MEVTRAEDYPHSFLECFILQNLQKSNPLNGRLLVQSIKEDSQDRSFMYGALEQIVEAAEPMIRISYFNVSSI
jgi:hypothetical protein